jgi:hypothetical protein
MPDDPAQRLVKAQHLIDWQKREIFRLQRDLNRAQADLRRAVRAATILNMRIQSMKEQQGNAAA